MIEAEAKIFAFHDEFFEVVEVMNAQPMMIDYAQPLLSNENIDWVVVVLIMMLFFPLIATGELWGRLPSNVLTGPLMLVQSLIYSKKLD